jgi:WD40 repeat protein
MLSRILILFVVLNPQSLPAQQIEFSHQVPIEINHYPRRVMFLDNQTIAIQVKSSKWIGEEPVGKVLIYNQETKRTIQTLECMGGVVMTFSPDRSRMVIGGPKNTLLVLETKTWKTIASLTGHTESYFGDIRFSQDNKTLITACHDGTARRWDLDSQKHLSMVSYSPTALLYAAIASDGKTLAYLDVKEKEILRIYDLQAEKLLATYRKDKLYFGTLIWSKDDTWLCVEHDQGSGFSICTKDGKEHMSLPRGKDYHQVTSFSADGRYLCSKTDNVIKVFDCKEKKEAFTLTHKHDVQYGIFTPNNTHLIVHDIEGGIHFWDLSTKRLLQRISNPGSLHMGTMISPDGKWITAHCWRNREVRISRITEAKKK